jgi:lathosterol oxidase
MDKNEEPNLRMRIGEGRISGALSIVFGSISFGGVLCFLFPDLLTTPEFRAQYDVEVLRRVLAACMFVSYAFALRSLIANASMRAGLVGAGLTTLALVLGGAGVEAGEVAGSPFYVSLDYLLLSLIAMALVFVPLELFFPERAQQTKFHPEWKTDLAYFVVAHLFVQGVAVLSQEPVWTLFAGVGLDGVRAVVAGLPYPAQVLLAVFTADLFQYWIHRLFHRLPYLWRFHAVHHSTRAMDWLAGSRLHLVDVVGTRMMVYLPLYVLGFAPEVLYTYVSIVAMHAVMNHTNTRLKYGPLEFLIVSPRIHHWHHSTEKRAHDKNFAVHFPWIDRLFGTYHAPAGEWPEEVGLDDATFPVGFIQQFLYPFLRDPEVGQPKGEVSTR